MSRSFVRRDLTKADNKGGWRFPAWAVLLAFGVSGAAGLVHEVVWSRLLRLVMGNTIFSITTVLCAFMGGLALGSYVGGRLIDRRRNPLLIFAALEATIGIYCAMLPRLIGAATPVFLALYQDSRVGFHTLSLARFALCGLLLLVPASAMGATLPVLSGFFVRLSNRVGWSVAMIYAANTLGAVAGAGATGFVLMPALGVTRTIFFACTLNLIVAVTAWLAGRCQDAGLVPQSSVPEITCSAAGIPQISRSTRPHGASRRQRREAPVAVGPYGEKALLALLIGYCLSGFAALAYEVAWTRVLSMLMGSSVYAFSMIVTAVILGLALGSAAFSRFADRMRDPMRALALIEVAIGLSALAVVPVFARIPQTVLRILSEFGDSFWQTNLIEFSMILLITLVPTFLMGAAFPLASRLYAEGRPAIERSIGTVYACNTAGAIAGSFFAGFVLIPLVGIEWTIFLIVLTNVLVGCFFLMFSQSMKWGLRTGSVFVSLGILAVGVIMIPRWDPLIMSSGPFMLARRETDEKILHGDLRAAFQKSTMVYYKEGLGTTVMVRDEGGVRSLIVNGKPDASNGSDMDTQVLLAHLPLLLHPKPQDALVVGLGSGITLGAATLHDLRSLDCVEISAPVVEASRYFDEYSHMPLLDPRVRLIISDGRNHVALTTRRYDVIISEPSNPWIAGIADLFTREYFELSRDRLRPGGILCIWLNAYDIKPYAFRSIITAFQSVFPEMSVWQTNPGDFILIGAKDSLAFDRRAFASRVAPRSISDDLKRIGILAPEQFLGFLVMGSRAAARLAGDAEANTDDNALLEFSPPALSRRANESEFDELLFLIEQHREADLTMLLGEPGHVLENDALRALASSYIEAKGHLNLAFIQSDRRPEEARKELEHAARLWSQNATFKQLYSENLDQAQFLAANGDFQEAITLYEKLLALAPDDALTHYHLGGALQQKGLVREAMAHLRRALATQPDMIPAAMALAWTLATSQDPSIRNVEEAVRLGERANELSQQSDARVLGTLAMAYAQADLNSKAMAALNRAMEIARKAHDEALIQEVQKMIDLCTRLRGPRPAAR
jgi:spermidine synthase